MTNTPTTVTDELAASLLERLGPAALVELTAFIGAANLSARSTRRTGSPRRATSSSRRACRSRC
ncbi:MAG: hypothetical protein ACRDRJ_20205 [Streptosporangiaceae bacterium]